MHWCNGVMVHRCNGESADLARSSQPVKWRETQWRRWGRTSPPGEDSRYRISTRCQITWWTMVIWCNGGR